MARFDFGNPPKKLGVFAVFFLLLTFLLNSCGFSEEERKAAEMACVCSKDQRIEGIRDCIRNAADSMNIEVGAYSYDRAFKEVCPDTYKRIMDFSKGKTKGVDEVPVEGN